MLLGNDIRVDHFETDYNKSLPPKIPTYIYNYSNCPSLTRMAKCYRMLNNIALPFLCEYIYLRERDIYNKHIRDIKSLVLMVLFQKVLL